MTTPDRRILPAAQAVLIDRAGRATPPFYDLLRRIVDATALTPELVAEIKQILEQIENLPTDGFMPITSRVVGQNSIEWQGLLANGLTTLSLQGDTSDQRATWYYGTNDANEKGWYRFYDALATGAGILKRNSGYVELGEVDDPSDLPGTGNIGEAYWVRGEGDIEERGLWVWDADAGEWALDTEASGIVGFEIAEGDYGDISVSDEGATWTINENVVTDEKLRDSAALSVIGRASNSTGDPADIAASADKAVLHRDGDALSFSPIDHTYISDFAEAAQDAVGGILTDSADIEFTYDDGNDEITAVLSAAVHSSLALADTAVQPGDLAAVAFSGDYGDLSNTPSIPSAANPSASVGLTAVNGSSDTFMRSDAAPALDQGISPTWTGDHIFSGAFALSNTQPELFLVKNDAASDEGVWATYVDATHAYLSALSDDLSTEARAMTWTRDGASIIATTVHSPLFLPDGSASEPALAFSSESGMGIYREGEDSLSVAVNGSIVARFNPVSTVIVGAFRFASIINPPQITANQNDYEPTGIATCAHVRLNSNASINITGLKRANLLGRVLNVFNVGSHNIVLKNEDAGSDAGNRFAIGADITIGPNQAVALFDDVTSQRWRCLARYG